MTLSSLRTLLRVRLYTAISPTVDIADYTEMPKCPIPQKHRSLQFPLPQSVLQQIPLHRQPRAPQICYQSAIALRYAAAAQLHPTALAAAILETHTTLPPSLYQIAIDVNATGWLSLTLSYPEGAKFLNQVLGSLPAPNDPHSCSHSCSPAILSFQEWQTLQRCRTLRSMLKWEDPPVNIDRDLMEGFSNPLPETQNLMATLLDELDTDADLSSPPIDHSRDHRSAITEISQAFDRLHRRIPLFHPATHRAHHLQFFYGATWTESILQTLHRNRLV